MYIICMHVSVLRDTRMREFVCVCWGDVLYGRCIMVARSEIFFSENTKRKEVDIFLLNKL